MRFGKIYLLPVKICTHILIIFLSMQQFKHPDSNIGLIFVAGSVGTTNLFLYCFFGKLATDSFDNMAYCMYASKWQALPINLQKYFILMIGNMQRPLYYHGFNVAYLNLETFCRVTNLLLISLCTFLIEEICLFV